LFVTTVSVSASVESTTGQRTLVPAIYHLKPGPRDDKGTDALKHLTNVVLQNINASQTHALDTTKNVDVSMVFVGIQNGAQLLSEQNGNPGACIQTTVKSDAVADWQRSQACHDQHAMRFLVAPDVPNGDSGESSDSCLYFPGDDCDGDGHIDAVEKCPCLDGFDDTKENIEYVTGRCSVKESSGTVVVDLDICNPDWYNEAGVLLDSDNDGAHDCMDVCPFFSLVPNKQDGDQVVQVPASCIALVERGEKCPNDIDEAEKLLHSDVRSGFADADNDGLYACEEECDHSALFIHSKSPDDTRSVCNCPVAGATDFSYLNALDDGVYGDHDGDGYINCIDQCPLDANFHKRNNCAEVPGKLGLCAVNVVGNPADAAECLAEPEYCTDEDIVAPAGSFEQCECSYTAEACDDAFPDHIDECVDVDDTGDETLPGVQRISLIKQMISEAKKNIVTDTNNVEITLPALQNNGWCTCVEHKPTDDDANAIALLDADNDGVIDCYEDVECRGVTGAFMDACSRVEPKPCIDAHPHIGDNHKVICPIEIEEDSKAVFCHDLTDSDGDGYANCEESCPNNPNRNFFKPHRPHTDPESCPCEFTNVAAASNSDSDTVVDCHDVCCSTRVLPSGKVETCPHVYPAYSVDDDNATNTNDDDNDGFLNCYDACPGHPNRDPTDPASPCERSLGAPPVVPPVKKVVSEPIHDYEWVLATVGGLLAGVVVGVITFRSDDDGAAAAAKAKSDRGK
jgi:hypothetical protein